MRILQIGSALQGWGGIERYVVYLTQGLIDRGHEVHVACPKGSPLDERCLGVHHDIVQRKQFSLGSIGAWKSLFGKEQFDVVHVHFSPDFIIPATCAKKWNRGALIMTRHLAEPWNRVKSWNYARTFDRIIGVSDAVNRQLIEVSGVPESKIVSAKAGVPSLAPTMDRQAARAELGIAPDEVAVGFFGRLTIEKGADYLLRAAQSWPEDVSLHIFGDGPQAPDLKAIQGRASLHGYVSEVADAMNAMDVIAIPSWWAEAFPYAALEAMSIGKPIVASAVGGLPEQVIDEENGLLVPPKDESKLSEAILALANNPELRLRMGERGQKMQREQFTIERFAERMESVYRSASGN